MIKLKKSSKEQIKKILVSFVLLITFIGTCMTIVFANENPPATLPPGGSSGGDDGGTGTSGKCKDCTCQFDLAPTYGVRISLVHWSTGQKEPGTKTIDVLASKTLSSWMAQHYQKKAYTISGDNSNKYNRVEMLGQINGNQTTNPSLDTTSWDAISQTVLTAADLGWTGSGISFNYNKVSSKISYSNFVLTLYTTMQKEVADYSATKDKSKLRITTTLFEKLEADFFSYTPEELEDLQIMIEPVVTFVINGTSNTGSWGLYYGTITQVAYSFQQKECNNGTWTIGNNLIREFGILLYGQQDCNTTGDKKYCYLNGWKAGDSIHSSNDEKVKRLALTDSNEKWAAGVGFIWLGDLKVPADDCMTVVNYVNGLWDAKKISETEYHNYISQIKDGTFSLEDKEQNKTYKVEEPQDYELLVKDYYVNYNEGVAACEDRQTMSQDCEAAIEYINSSNSYPKRSDAYINAVEQVRTGEFSYKLPDGQTIKIDKSYDYDMLEYDTYINNGGEAKCEDLESTCEAFTGSNVIIDECETGKTFFGDINDPDAWLKCEIAYTNGAKVYSSDNTGHTSEDDDVVGNGDYCEIFCYEEFETGFPLQVTDVKAGQTFLWGTPDGAFGTVTIRKKCSTQNYNPSVKKGYLFEEWENDYKNNEREMIEHYMNKASYEKMKNNITTSSSSAMTKCCNCCHYVPVTCPDGSSGCTSWVCGPNDCEKRYSGTATAPGKSHSYNGGSYIGNVTGSVSTESYTTGYVHMTAATAESVAKSKLLGILDGLIVAEDRAYEDGILEETDLNNKLKQCTKAIKYEMVAKVQFIFAEPENIDYDSNTRDFTFNNLLVDPPEELVKPNGTANTSACIPTDSYTYKCDGEGSGATCTPTYNQVLDCSLGGVTWDLYGVYEFNYPKDEFQWYTYKVDGTLLNQKNKGTENPDLYYFVGFGLPTALSLTDGLYELKAITYNLGDNAIIERPDSEMLYEKPTDTHFDPLAPIVNTIDGSKKGFEYVCTYEVDNEIFGYDCQYDDSGRLLATSPEYCDPFEDDETEKNVKGIDITYRLVALLSEGDFISKAFPGRDGAGRQPGSNWRGLDEDIEYILRASIYDEPAMYEFMLDVNAIQQIRKDNQSYFEKGKDPYASYYDAGGVKKVFCADKGGQKYCASDFISKLNAAGNEYNYPLMGTCLPVNDTKTRAEYVLNNGCDAAYRYPELNWTR